MSYSFHCVLSLDLQGPSDLGTIVKDESERMMRTTGRAGVIGVANFATVTWALHR